MNKKILINSSKKNLDYYTNILKNIINQKKCPYLKFYIKKLILKTVLITKNNL